MNPFDAFMEAARINGVERGAFVCRDALTGGRGQRLNLVAVWSNWAHSFSDAPSLYADELTVEGQRLLLESYVTGLLYGWAGRFFQEAGANRRIVDKRLTVTSTGQREVTITQTGRDAYRVVKDGEQHGEPLSLTRAVTMTVAFLDPARRGTAREAAS